MERQRKVDKRTKASSDSLQTREGEKESENEGERGEVEWKFVHGMCEVKIMFSSNSLLPYKNSAERASEGTCRRICQTDLRSNKCYSYDCIALMALGLTHSTTVLIERGLK